MRRLDILLTGKSQALTDLALELEQHGHSLARLANLEALPPGTFDLLIDDASLPLQDFGYPHSTKCRGLRIYWSTMARRFRSPVRRHA